MNRQEFTCKSCGKKRVLSIEEARDDGWVVDVNGRLLCPNCLPTYGFPTGQFSGIRTEQPSKFEDYMNNRLHFIW